MADVLFPFGAISGQALGDARSTDLEQLLDTTRLSSGLALAMRNELRARGRPYLRRIGPTGAPSTSGGLQCWCGGEAFFPHWQLRDGQQAIENVCTRCGASAGRLPLTPGNADRADRAAYGLDRHDWR
jgi:hypothetical protein